MSGCTHEDSSTQVTNQAQGEPLSVENRILTTGAAATQVNHHPVIKTKGDLNAYKTIA